MTELELDKAGGQTRHRGNTESIKTSSGLRALFVDEHHVITSPRTPGPIGRQLSGRMVSDASMIQVRPRDVAENDLHIRAGPLTWRMASVLNALDGSVPVVRSSASLKPSPSRSNSWIRSLGQ
jgi:hypothetical protein